MLSQPANADFIFPAVAFSRKSVCVLLATAGLCCVTEGNIFFREISLIKFDLTSPFG